MSPTKLDCLRKSVYCLCCAFVLGYAASASADPKPLTKEEQAKVDKAVDRAVAFLKGIQRDEGDWPAHLPYAHLGQTLLPAYALLEAGVPANDPTIQKAVAYLRPVLAKRVRADNGWADSGDAIKKKLMRFLSRYDTYQFSLAILFLDRLGDPKDKKLIQSLALRLIAGQHWTGGWSYSCPIVTEEDEAHFLKLLIELNKRMEAGEKSSAKLLKDLDVPPSLRALTVFQDRQKFKWRESFGNALKTGGKAPDRLDTGPTDNSNTQFAMLALWVAQRHGIPACPTFDLMVERFQRTQGANGWWSYAGNRPPTRSMICVGLLGLAIGQGLQLAPQTSPRQAGDVRVLKGLVALYGEVGIPKGRMEKPVPYTADVYFLWSLERVGMLYDLPTLGDKEWYRWGAEILVTNQKPDGHWDGAKFDPKDTKTMMSGYHPPMNTAFALLFLKRSHPMKELTPKLPFTAKELNQGIARLRPSGGNLEGSTDSPSQSKKPDPSTGGHPCL